MNETPDTIERFLYYLRYEVHASERTVCDYAQDLNRYAAFFSEHTGEVFEPSERDKDVARAWLFSLMEAGQKSSSVQRRLSALKSFYKYMVKIGLIGQSPVRMLRGPKKERPLPVFVPNNEMEKVLNKPIREDDFEAVRDRLILETLYEVGLRRSEIATLKDNAVEDKAGCIRIIGKRNKERIVPFGKRLQDMIDNYRIIREEKVGKSDFFFVSLDGRPLTGEVVYKIVRTALANVPHLTKRSPHVLRHSFATEMLNHGADLMSVKELLGHDSLSTTVQYTHISFEQLRQMYNAHPRAKKEETTMTDVRIQALHFDATDQLKEFVQKKISKLNRLSDGITGAEVVLKLVKPETVQNKEASIRLYIPGDDLFAEKIADTFEEAIDLTVDALKRQIEKRKEQRK